MWIQGFPFDPGRQSQYLASERPRAGLSEAR